ncbi:zinc finger BED domain-containing protein 5-like [Aplysia californica]|uniref:Zinc finger BED domain-containing protein 5-like n=1 Tax=Aplysia californica TaxID=6500 RepID=A0ABM0JF92_APLCA|nr:zinc finger BED domain-containing protein 5-like [Aplysia californica]
MSADHETLLFYTQVRWLSKGNVVCRVFEPREEIKFFLEVQGKDELLNQEDTLSADFQADIAAHLKPLEDEFKNYFSDLDCSEEALVRNHFTPGVDVSVLADDIQDELLELRHDSSARDTFLEKSLAQFWCSLQELYPQVSKTAL